MNEIELKPCPFCGWEAHLWFGNTTVAVACSACEIFGMRHEFGEGCVDRVVEAWNRRKEAASE